MSASPAGRAPAPGSTWIGAGLFAVSLGYFLFTYGVTFAEPAAGAVRPADLGWNLALFSGFALHHSLLARPRHRALIARTVPAGLERTLYVSIASVLFIAVCAAWRPIPGVAWRVDGAARWGMLALQLAGIWLTIRSASLIGIRTLAGLSPQTEAPATFTRAGPYGRVRHPIYAGWFLFVFAAPVMTMTRLVFAVISCAYILLAIPFEERTLRAAAPDAYRRYADEVRWRLLPGVF